MVRLHNNALALIALSFLAIIGLIVLWQLSRVVLLGFTSLLLAIFLYSLSSFFSRYSPLNSHLSLLLSILLLLALLGGIGWFIGPRLANQMSELTSQISQPLDKLEQWFAEYGWGKTLLKNTPVLEVPSAESSATESRPISIPDRGLGDTYSWNNVLERIFGAVSSFLGGVTDLFFVLAVGVFLASNPHVYLKGLLRLFPKHHKMKVKDVCYTLYATLQLWLLGQLASMLLVGILTGLGLWILGMPLVLALAFLAFLLEFIPILGPWISGIPAILLALPQGLSTTVLVMLVYVVVQQLEGNIIMPLIQKRTLSIPPVLTLTAIFAGGAVFSFLGLLVATPLAATLLVLIKMLYVRDTLGYNVELPGKP
ncbi:MAG: AI-2E family transporter [Trueperaceae bacterium]|nr:AI-2E family transporter [Trueperaceae bacterium]